MSYKNCIEGWPKIYIEVYHLDWLGRSHLFGYGHLTVPCSPGQHTLDCFTWRPLGGIKDRFVQYFLGGSLHLKNPDLIVSPNDRHKLKTESMGIVTFDINTILRYFTNFGVEYK